METLGDNLVAKSGKKVASDFYCENCDYKCSKKYNWEKHLLTAKHQMETFGDSLVAKSGKNGIIENFQCENCNKTYISRNGLWKHKKTCKTHINIIQNNLNEPTDKELIMMLIKENSDLKTMMMKVLENGTHNTNSHNTTNSHNKAFNLQFFLNETCKDAMNIMDFVDSIKLQLSDLENVGEVGYVEGISDIIVSNLKKLDVTKRPVHCTDKKRETMYIKDEDKWEKDEQNVKLHKFVRKVAAKNQRLLPKFKEEHPDCLQYHSKYSDQYNKIVYESMGGKGDNDYEKEEKIIKRVSKEVTIDKIT
jgi:hypothetical protein